MQMNRFGSNVDGDKPYLKQEAFAPKVSFRCSSHLVSKGGSLEGFSDKAPRRMRVPAREQNPAYVLPISFSSTSPILFLARGWAFLYAACWVLKLT